MTKSTFSIDASVFSDIHDTETFGAGVKSENKERSEELNERKITSYSNLIACIGGIKLTKGNLPKYARDAIWDGLTVDAGVSKSVAKKYLENSVGAVRHFDFPTQATGSFIEAKLIEEGITSESKLTKLVKGEDTDTPEMAVARTFIGGFTTRKDDEGNRVKGVFKFGKETEEDDPFAAVERLRLALDEVERIARAAIEAAAGAEEDRATYEQVMAALDD